MTATPVSFLPGSVTASREHSWNVQVPFALDPHTGLPEHLTNVEYIKKDHWKSDLSIATDAYLGRDVIVKTGGESEELRNEIMALIALQDQTRNVIPLLAAFHVGSQVYMELPRLAGALCDFFLEDDFVLYTLRELLGTLSVLHEKNIWHRDIKPDNILVVSTGRPDIVLADFGAAHLPNDGPVSWQYTGTPEYMAPEVLACVGHTEKCDIWSLGMTVITILLRVPRPPEIPSGSTYGQIDRWMNDIIDRMGVAEEIKGVLRGMMRSNPNERFGARQALACMPPLLPCSCPVPFDTNDNFYPPEDQ